MKKTKMEIEDIIGLILMTNTVVIIFFMIGLWDVDLVMTSFNFGFTTKIIGQSLLSASTDPRVIYHFGIMTAVVAFLISEMITIWLSTTILKIYRKSKMRRWR